MRKHNYVVGYEGEGQCVYGSNESYHSIDLKTLIQARKLSKNMHWTDKKGKRHNSVIYKLVRVK